MSIEIKDLVKIYGEQKAVDGISFKVGQGEIVGFLGPNGAGKSTTMKIITGYLGQDEGEVTVCGIPVKQHPLETRKKIGYLPEANPLYPDMYVREYLDFIADAHAVPEKKQKIESVIATVGLTPESKKKLGQLSKGYKQRVGLAAALLHDPEVLILDEPTSGLDPNQIIEIRDTIKKLGQNKTVLFSSHILQEVEALCDRVVIINKGKLIADSPLGQLRLDNRTNAIRVAFKEDLETSRLQALKGVTSVRKLADREWELQAGEDTDVKKQLLELALQNNWNIVSLQSENQSLEEIFRHLTT
ncbi:gliding motility-associated ABC transporter ATP-binding subunit GldA [Flavitalea sp. BT771]|uniref:gliding motility-associated ABC transporter ATP-binding subunit GldA n=1 Tax=Flavitalea sp. BT771 TaxID=3063329 RepID=UPI0026E2388D|nr:gliding motility-associated ABC transporter ATP-binding subunit GldA [Flavitalea sp. BT771]MDO6434252.1 gliding motility-associated ABC transporter ATP-binding subunit GldA [Flavitalea sp. BT771]MDV6223152.1 gliding motility-associated ABC transporter ATP-binding subunit GldA [Flavitalea sp. BT771]